MWAAVRTATLSGRRREAAKGKVRESGSRIPPLADDVGNDVGEECAFHTTQSEPPCGGLMREGWVTTPGTHKEENKMKMTLHFRGRRKGGFAALDERRRLGLGDGDILVEKYPSDCGDWSFAVSEPFARRWARKGWKTQRMYTSTFAWKTWTSEMRR